MEPITSMQATSNVRVSCITSFGNMGNCQSAHVCIAEPAHVPTECFMCCKAAVPAAILNCGHSIHAPCLTTWWLRVPTQALKCPLCMQESDDCILELDVATHMPIGFYRKGFMGRLQVDSSVTTTFVKINEDGRDLAQAVAMGVWAKHV